MIDVEYIKRGSDCRDLIERDLGRPKYRNQTYSTHKCPLHNEHKGYSLVVYADGWRCFGKCDRGGDAIAWLREYHQLTFREACERLSSGDLPRVERPVPVPQAETPSQPPNDDWQRAAHRVANIAMTTLWGESGQRAWHYLEHERGLTEQAIVDGGLGYIPGGPQAWKTVAGLRVPCGITIPWITRGTIWGIKVRRAAGPHRYQQVAGGSIKDGLFLGGKVQPGLPLLLTEGEFDALIAYQCGTGLVSAAAIGSAANWRIHPRWYPAFLSAPQILVCTDDDDAGHKAARQIGRLSQATRRVHVPHGKDLNAFYLQAGGGAVRAWIGKAVRNE